MPCSDSECPSNEMWPYFLGVLRQFCPVTPMTEKQRRRVWKWSKSYGKMIACTECAAQWRRMIDAIKKHRPIVFKTRATVLSFFHDIRNVSRMSTGLSQLDYEENCAYIPVLTSIMQPGTCKAVPRGSTTMTSAYSKRLRSEMVVADDLTSGSGSSSDMESNTSEVVASPPSPSPTRVHRIVTAV